jgi:hypothetical protein
LRGTESCGKLQARCGETVAARVVFARFGVPNDAEKRGDARVYAARVVNYHFETLIPASIKALIRCVHALPGLIAARVVAKSKAA